MPAVSPMDDAIPALTRAQMAEIDRLMIEEAGISLIQMMENAGRSLARLAIERYRPSSVTVLAGPGGNGGGALVAARHLANRDVSVEVSSSRAPGAMTPVARHQLEALGSTSAHVVEHPAAADLTLDGLIGYSLSGRPRGREASLIEWTLEVDAPVLSLDTPSGIDVTDGTVNPPAVSADATLTLALPKTGLIDHPAVGDLFLADISVPAALYERIGITVPADLFAAGQVRRVSAPE